MFGNLSQTFGLRQTICIIFKSNLNFILVLMNVFLNPNKCFVFYIYESNKLAAWKHVSMSNTIYIYDWILSFQNFRVLIIKHRTFDKIRLNVRCLEELFKVSHYYLQTSAPINTPPPMPLQPISAPFCQYSPRVSIWECFGECNAHNIK
jgi:hypothetical protein